MTSDSDNIFARWYRDYLSDPQIVIFVLMGAFVVALFTFLGEYLAPIIASLVVAYLLEGFIRPLEYMHIPRLAAVGIVFTLFILALVFLVLGLVPMLSAQISQFVQAMPKMLSTWQDQLQTLPQKYPQLITEDQVNRIMGIITNQFNTLARNFFSFSLASVRSLLNFVVYLVLVPLMAFFLLKDKTRILHFLQGLLPENIHLANQVWQEVNEKIAKFIQGKIWEILIVWVGAYITFAAFGLQFSVLLGLLVGLSVIVPYVGALLMTIPVALVAFFQWGFEPRFIYILIAYGILQFLDGNVLVPLLMSEIVNLHPLAIIIGIIIFGGLWGVWGVLFAIPLATLVNAIIKAWPRKSRQSNQEEDLHAG